MFYFITAFFHFVDVSRECEYESEKEERSNEGKKRSGKEGSNGGSKRSGKKVRQKRKLEGK